LATTAAGRALLGNRWLRILSIAFIMYVIADGPHEARWLHRAERERLVAALAAERSHVEVPLGHWLSTLWHPAVLLLAFYNFAALTAEYGVNFWLPTVLKEAGRSILTVGFLSAIPYAVGALLMILVAWNSDRTQERKWHMIGATGISAAGRVRRNARRPFRRGTSLRPPRRPRPFKHRGYGMLPRMHLRG